MKTIWNWNIFACEIIISQTKRKRLYIMKYLFHMQNELIQNVTCEILVYETYFTYEMAVSLRKISFTYDIYRVFLSDMELKQFWFEIPFSYMKLHLKSLLGILRHTAFRHASQKNLLKDIWEFHYFKYSLLDSINEACLFYVYITSYPVNNICWTTFIQFISIDNTIKGNSVCLRIWKLGVQYWFRI